MLHVQSHAKSAHVPSGTALETFRASRRNGDCDWDAVGILLERLALKVGCCLRLLDLVSVIRHNPLELLWPKLSTFDHSPTFRLSFRGLPHHHH
jgi:hypothetical protein